MDAEYHLFVDADAGPCGAILRHIEPRRLRSRTVFKMGGDAPVYLVDQLVEHDGDVRRWTRFEYDSPSSQTKHEGVRDEDGTVHVDGEPAPDLTDAVGAYGEHLVLGQLLRTGEDVLSYLQFDEAEPHEGVETATLHRRGGESTELLGGTTITAERVQLVLGGRPTNVHWAVDGVTVKSDWCGAQSFLVDDLEAVLEGLDEEVVARIEEFVAGTPRRIRQL